MTVELSHKSQSSRKFRIVERDRESSQKGVLAHKINWDWDGRSGMKKENNGP